MHTNLDLQENGPQFVRLTLSRIVWTVYTAQMWMVSKHSNSTVHGIIVLDWGERTDHQAPSKLNYLITLVKKPTKNNLVLHFMKEVFYLIMHTTHFMYDDVMSDIWLKTTDNERGNLLSSLHGLHFPISIPFHRHHNLCYTSCEALAGTRSSLMGPP